MTALKNSIQACKCQRFVLFKNKAKQWWYSSLHRAYVNPKSCDRWSRTLEALSAEKGRGRRWGDINLVRIVYLTVSGEKANEWAAVYLSLAVWFTHHSPREHIASNKLVKSANGDGNEVKETELWCTYSCILPHPHPCPSFYQPQIGRAPW